MFFSLFWLIFKWFPNVFLLVFRQFFSFFFHFLLLFFSHNILWFSFFFFFLSFFLSFFLILYLTSFFFFLFFFLHYCPFSFTFFIFFYFSFLYIHFSFIFFLSFLLASLFFFFISPSFFLSFFPLYLFSSLYLSVCIVCTHSTPTQNFLLFLSNLTNVVYTVLSSSETRHCDVICLILLSEASKQREIRYHLRVPAIVCFIFVTDSLMCVRVCVPLGAWMRGKSWMRSKSRVGAHIYLIFTGNNH